MQTYLELLNHVLTHGSEKTDRTGTGTRSIFGAQVRYDLQKGFPLLTTKKLHTKSIIHELLWFLRGDTNANSLKAVGVNIWNEWATEEQCAKQNRANGDLGPVYGNMWREWRTNDIIKIEPRIREKESPIQMPIFPLQKPDKEERKNDLVGKEIKTKKYGEYTVLRSYKNTSENTDKHKLYDVQFKNTGYISTKNTYTGTKAGQIKDVYAPTIFGVACIGEEAPQTTLERGLYQQWFSMLCRCYNPNHVGYKNYGGTGTFVCNRWLNFSNFKKDAQLLEGWRERRLNPTGVELDKDYFSSNCYSPETCVWLSQAENTTYTGHAIEAELESKEKRIYLSKREASRELNISRPCIKASIENGKPTKNVQFRILKGNYRKRLRIDQLENLITEIKTNPSSRRLLITAWDPRNKDKVALEPCHCLMQFYVNDGILSCQLYQRSADIFLGVPFNIASYALLTEMIAKLCGLKAGEFIHTFGDLHLYNNHVEQAKLQLSRTPKTLPTLKIVGNQTKITDFCFEDFILENYNPEPSIKAEVAV
jgi:thymidylate synthase